MKERPVESGFGTQPLEARCVTDCPWVRGGKTVRRWEQGGASV